MARPKSKGLNYFSHDTDMSDDEKMQFIEAEHGLVGYAVYNKLLELIYRHEGYFMVFNDRYSKLLSKRFGIEQETLVSILTNLINEGLFSKNLYLSFGIITSERIQSNYVQACDGRRECEFYEEYILIDPKKSKGEKSITEIIIKKLPKIVSEQENAVSEQITIINNPETTVSGQFGTQIKEKVKETKVNQTETGVDFFEMGILGKMKEVWIEVNPDYPEKDTDSRALNSIKFFIYDQIVKSKRAIDPYFGNKVSDEDILGGWRVLAKTVMEDNWLKLKPLTTIDTQIQGVFQQAKANKNGQGKINGKQDAISKENADKLRRIMAGEL